MKKSRSTDEQIIGFLRQVEGAVPLKDRCRKHGFSDATFYRWRSRLGGLDVSEERRLRELESENTKLKKLLYGNSLSSVGDLTDYCRRPFWFRVLHGLSELA